MRADASILRTRPGVASLKHLVELDGSYRYKQNKCLDYESGNLGGTTGTLSRPMYGASFLLESKI